MEVNFRTRATNIYHFAFDGLPPDPFNILHDTRAEKLAAISSEGFFEVANRVLAEHGNNGVPNDTRG